ncbi:MAG: phage/plasmid primase, P4 family [Acetobacteraceae bacterium]
MSGSAGIDFAALIGPVARHLLGEPNSALSTASTLRFGNHGSLAVEVAGNKRGQWFDHERGEGGGTLDLIMRETRCANGEVLAWMRERGFIVGEIETERRIVATYDYRDASGTLLSQVVRFEPKDFRQRRPDGNGGWNWSVTGIKRVPYRMPELLNASVSATVFLPEGEKDVDMLRERGLIATCNPGGAGKWTIGMSAHLRGRDVVILPDHDDAGDRHALDVAAKLFGIACTVRILRLPNLPPKGDVSDWLAAGATAEELQRLVAEAPQHDGAAAEPPKAEQSGDHPRPPEFSDLALAQRFTAEHADHLRYVASWGHWMVFDGATWRPDATMLGFDLARAVCKTAATTCKKQRVAAAIASAKAVAAVERLARADRRHAATAEQWDADPWLLNTPGGTIDLRTGTMRPHQLNDCMTKCTAVSPGGECSRWLGFLDRITGRDTSLRLFLQRAAGYSLTGITREHALFFGYGAGANGKGTFLNTLTGVFGNYSAIASMEAFTASPTDRHPADLAMLRGARLVAAQEMEAGRRWAEARIKALTGGDPIAARFMRQNFFTFVPMFKLFIAGNHKPALRGVDEAMRRRIHLIPFAVTIPAEERDPTLADQLRSEWSGILAWAVTGCLDWQRQGLAPPAAVTAATGQYFEGEDILALWMAERCKRVGYGGTECSKLFADWRTWALAAGEEPGSQKRFSQSLEARGLSKRPGGRHATFDGIALDDVQPAWTEPDHERA